MTAAEKLASDAAIGVAVADALEGLSSIHDPSCGAVVWRRQPLQSFQSWIDSLDPERLPHARVVVQPNAVGEAVRHSCDLAETPDCAERDLLIDDIAALAHGFGAISSAEYLRLRLDVVSTNACRKFHIDSVTSRLICTYRGTGTQYGVSPDGSDPTRVFTAPTGAPIVLRGTLWPQTPPTGLLHRSPPIAGTGETRLLLVLDPMQSAAEDPEHVFH
ncbi:MAG: DUF1826 domain-containing protein [Pseudomonadota bacterium]